MACKTLANARTAPAPRSQLVARTAPRRVTSLQPRPQHLRAVLAGAGGDGCCGGGAPASSSAQDKVRLVCQIVDWSALNLSTYAAWLLCMHRRRFRLSVTVACEPHMSALQHPPPPPPALQASSGGGCGCSGSSAPGGQGVAMQQLSSMMGGMEGSLTRQDMQAAMEAAGTQRGVRQKRKVQAAW